MTPATKAPFRFPLTGGDIEAFCHPSEGSAFRRPAVIDGRLCAANHHIALRAETGRWHPSDYPTAPAEMQNRLASLPWGQLPAATLPGWRALDDARGTIYRYAPISPFTDKLRTAPSPVWEVAGNQLVRLSHLQIIARLPACKIWIETMDRRLPLFFRYNGGHGLIAHDPRLTIASFKLFPPSYDLAGHRRERRTCPAPSFVPPPPPEPGIDNWPPAEPTDD